MRKKARAKNESGADELMGRLQKKPPEPHRSIRKQSETVPMSKVKYISASTEIPTGQNYVLVVYGDEYGEARHAFGVTITVARNLSKTISDLSFLTAIHSAK
jgi:hypothetical protein